MKSKRNPLHSKYTLFTGSYQAFTGTALSPDDPEFKRRARRRRPADASDPIVSKRRSGKKPKK